MDDSTSQPIQPQPDPQHPPFGNRSKSQDIRKIGVIAALLLVVTAIPLTMYLTKQEQDIRQEASVGANFKITCQPIDTFDLNGSREIRAVVRDVKTNQLVNGRTVIWSIKTNPGNWIASVTNSSKTNQGIAIATVRSNPAIVSNSEGIITARVNGDNAALCQVRAKNTQKAPPAQSSITPQPSEAATPSPTSTSPSSTPRILMPTDSPSPDPSPTTSVNPSQLPTENDPDLSTTPPVGSHTSIHFSVLLHGIGISGDSVLPEPEECRRRFTTTDTNALPIPEPSVEASLCLNNNNPLHPVREVSVEIRNQQNQPIMLTPAQITYDSDFGFFTGSIDLGDAWTSGPYLIKFKTPMNLIKQVGGIHMLTAGQEYKVPRFDLVSGDVNSNNQLEVLDYNMILECATYEENDEPKCDTEVIASRDTNDDGKIDLFDSRLFLRNLSVQYGN